MSANQSNLSNAHYGYDLVVATTQGSINKTMKKYLETSDFPVVKMYWNQDALGNPVQVSYEKLMAETNGTDPLLVPEWQQGDPKTTDIDNINKSQFYFAFEAAIGVPKGTPAGSIPDVVKLLPASNSVIFNLFCSQFKVVTCNFGRQGLTSFQSVQQTSDAPWTFTSTVPLKNIIDNINLPPFIQQKLKNLNDSNAFSVQQLFFDLDNAALESTPTIKGVDPGTPAYTLLSQVFIGAYFSAMKSAAAPVLGYTFVHNKTLSSSSLAITDLALEVSPYSSQQPSFANLNTLNYLCSVNSNPLPPSVPFGWNWIEQPESANFDGIISINRNTFANYLKNQLTDYVARNCFLSHVNVYTEGGITGTTYFQWSLTPGQTPTITTSTNGPDVLTFAYTSEMYDDSHQGAAHQYMAGMTLSSSYSATVSFVGNTIVITQNLKMYVAVHGLFNAHTLKWLPINKTITDTYTLTLSSAGSLNASMVSVSNDASEPPPQDDWFTDMFTNLNGLASDIGRWMENFKNTNFLDIPVGAVQNFVFPAGKTFKFIDANFSNNQDMVAHISYL